jgi:hypothetical protein
MTAAGVRAWIIGTQGNRVYNGERTYVIQEPDR